MLKEVKTTKELKKIEQDFKKNLKIILKERDKKIAVILKKYV
ncbi:MAG: hypothetical protein ACOYMB_04645 [Patescibacteria group bacterium]